jgi:hypothetical protein
MEEWFYLVSLCLSSSDLLKIKNSLVVFGLINAVETYFPFSDKEPET